MGAASGLEQIPCDDACQMELLKNDEIVDGCLFVKNEEAGDFLVCDEDVSSLFEPHLHTNCSLRDLGWCIAIHR